MAALTITLSEEEEARLRARAAALGVTPEELLRRGIGEWLARDAPTFEEAARYVLAKNAELYRRLA